MVAHGRGGAPDRVSSTHVRGWGNSLGREAAEQSRAGKQTGTAGFDRRIRTRSTGARPGRVRLTPPSERDGREPVRGSPANHWPEVSGRAPGRSADVGEGDGGEQRAHGLGSAGTHVHRRQRHHHRERHAKARSHPGDTPDEFRIGNPPPPRRELARHRGTSDRSHLCTSGPAPGCRPRARPLVSTRRRSRPLHGRRFAAAEGKEAS